VLELGRVYLALDRPEAEGVLKQSMELASTRLGRGPHLLPIVNSLAECYVETGDFDAFFTLSESVAIDNWMSHRKGNSD
jgi:hypothetical protein